MAAISLKQNLSPRITPEEPQQRTISVEIPGLIRVFKDGHVERPHLVPCVPPSLAPELGVTCGDATVDQSTSVWARIYLPRPAPQLLPLLVYFHGGGFCVGSASWACYHQFLGQLASAANCVVVSVDYRLAPENPLPAAYDDGAAAVGWVRRQAEEEGSGWWASRCDFKRIFLGGDSAGGNIACHVALRQRPEEVRGLILIQPFFGGEERTGSERQASAGSALTLAAADAYWRMALPEGANRDHPWCNPAAPDVDVLVCVSGMDILRDRNLEFCGRRVERVVYEGVGHAFQILDRSPLAQIRARQMICRIKDFVAM
ncbi:alpha/beta-Hydrolases superfamily protein [Striga asiatica]|uniref:Alpha/beta-Hydrolases superfamily protein n=1 Tax=Striga asiatica TaxID=4170 RepID=A0A5A7P6U7_STRAF|nr:alpha/beta-Hydrolases superfamily protein [Striga asiatica]